MGKLNNDCLYLILSYCSDGRVSELLRMRLVSPVWKGICERVINDMRRYVRLSDRTPYGVLAGMLWAKYIKYKRVVSKGPIHMDMMGDIRGIDSKRITYRKYKVFPNIEEIIVKEVPQHCSTSFPNLKRLHVDSSIAVVTDVPRTLVALWAPNITLTAAQVPNLRKLNSTWGPSMISIIENCPIKKLVAKRCDDSSLALVCRHLVGTIKKLTMTWKSTEAARKDLRLYGDMLRKLELRKVSIFAMERNEIIELDPNVLNPVCLQNVWVDCVPSLMLLSGITRLTLSDGMSRTLPPGLSTLYKLRELTLSCYTINDDDLANAVTNMPKLCKLTLFNITGFLYGVGWASKVDLVDLSCRSSIIEWREMPRTKRAAVDKVPAKMDCEMLVIDNNKDPVDCRPYGKLRYLVTSSKYVMAPVQLTNYTGITMPVNIGELKELYALSVPDSELDKHSDILRTLPKLNMVL
jgi:hypothetical protein